MNCFRIFMVSMLMLPLSIIGAENQELLRPIAGSQSEKKGCQKRDKRLCGAVALIALALGGAVASSVHTWNWPKPPPPFPGPDVGEGCNYITAKTCSDSSCSYRDFSPTCLLYNSSSPELTGCPPYAELTGFGELDKDWCANRTQPYRCYSQSQVAQLFPRWCQSLPPEPTMKTSQPALPNSTTGESMRLRTPQQKLRAKLQRLENARRAR